jgi:hypothetical protein
MPFYSSDVNAAINNSDINKLKSILESQPLLLTTEYFGVLETPLHYCGGYGNLDFFKFLVNMGLDVNISLKGYETPLGPVAYENKLEIAQWLLSNGAYVDGLETSLLTPMMNAIYARNPEMVRLLVENGANVNRMHIRNGMLPLDVALSVGNDEIVSYLKSHGAKSQYELPDWVENDVEGDGILSHVSIKAGKILPVDIRAEEAEKPVVLKLASVNNKLNRLLFTFGLFSVHTPRIELFITLPQYWNFYVTTPENQFPILLLSELIKQIKDGLKIEEGYYIRADDDKFKHLVWPQDIACFYVSDVKWKTKDNDDNEGNKDDDDVYLYSLIPVKKTKNGFAEQSLEKNRNAGWTKLCLNI